MTLEEAYARIAELEAENRKLAKNHRKLRDRIPIEIQKKHPSLFTSYGKFVVDENAISVLIRAACFPRIERMSHIGRENRRPVVDKNAFPRLVDFTDRQYTFYCQALDAILNELELHKWEECEE